MLAQLGVDDYINRRYIAADAPPVALYVGYYASQRQGDYHPLAAELPAGRRLAAGHGRALDHRSRRPDAFR